MLRRRRVLSTMTLLGGAVLFALPNVALGASGDRDAGFGTNGTATINGDPDFEIPRAVAKGPNGTVVIAGSGNYGLYVARFTAAGDPDTSFGGGDGLVTISYGAPPLSYLSMDTGLAVLGTGKILVVGTYTDNNANPPTDKLFITRLKANGAKDTNFGGGDGIVVSNFGMGHTYGNALLVRSNGDFVVAGSAPTGDGVTGDLALWHFSAGGKHDTTFGNGGDVALMDVGPGPDDVFHVVETGTGDFVVAGQTVQDNGDTDVAVARFNGDGSIDHNFSGDGYATFNLTSYPSEWAAGLAKVGKKLLIMSPGTNGAEGDVELLRLNSNGSPDANFSGGGTVVRDLGGDEYPKGMTTDANGRILVTGYQYSQDTDTNHPFVARFSAKGVLDTTFGNAGVATADTEGKGRDVMIDANANIVITGDTPVDSFAARFLP